MLKNIGWMTISTLLRLGAGFVLFVILARNLGPENFGQLAYWLAFSSLLALLVNYGFGLQLLREIGKNPESAAEIYGATLAAKMVLSIAVIVAGLLIGLREDTPLAIFWCLLLMALAESFSEHLNYALRGLGYFDKEARFALVTSALNFIGVLLPLLVYKTVAAVAAGFFLSRCVSLLVGWCLAKPYLPVMTEGARSWTISSIVKTLREGFPYAADMAVSTLNSTLDVLLLSYFATPRAVGLYQAGLKLMQGANSLAPIIGNVYTPYIASLQKDEKESSLSVDKMILKMVLIGGCFGVVFSAGNKLIAEMLYGDQYGSLSDLLPWFGLALFARFVAAGFGINLTARGLQNVRVYANGAALFALVLVAVFAIPIFGAVGMLLAFVVSTSLVGASYCYALHVNRVPTGMSKTNIVLAFALVVPIVFQVLSGRVF